MLDRATRGLTADFLGVEDTLNDLYLIVHAVEGLPSGAYVFRRSAARTRVIEARAIFAGTPDTSDSVRRSRPIVV